MTKMITVYIGVLMLAMHFSSQVHANSTMTPTNVTGTSYSMTTMVNGTGNGTAPSAGVSLQSSSAFTLLVPVALASFLLHGRF